MPRLPEVKNELKQLSQTGYKMLKSHFNLTPKDEEEAMKEEEVDVREEVVAEEEKLVEIVAKRILHKSEVSVRLSLLGKTADGDGYTYLKAVCTNMSLTNIDALKCFQHLQFVNLSRNNLDLEGLQAVTALPFLVLLQADNNRVESAALYKTKYLQVLILNYNHLTSVEDVYQSELSTLEVGYNKIAKVSFINRMPNLKCLDFRYNVIGDIDGIDFPNLDSLYLAGNKINSLVGLEMLVNLRILHLRNNPIRNLNGFEPELRKLMYINLRNCKVGTLIQIKKLRPLPALHTLILKGCPYMGGTGKEEADNAGEEEDPELRVEVLAALPKLKRLNKTEYTPEERLEAKDLMTLWLEEGEKDEEEVTEEGNNEEEAKPEED